MTREELQKIIDRFNIDKKANNWKEFLDNNKTMKRRELRKYMPNYPEYYEFIKPSELRYWIENSEKEGFIDERFCPICGKFIAATKAFHDHYRCGCDEHLNRARALCAERANLKKYGVRYPLQSKEIHAKTIASGKASGNFKIGAQKAMKTKIEKYGDVSNGKKISETRKNWTKERKDLWYARVKATKLERYGDENYQNIEKVKATNLERYGVDNPSKTPEIKKIIAERAVATRKKNGTLPRDLMRSDKIYKDGLTYKEYYVNSVHETKKKNGTLNTSHNFEDKLVQYLRETYPEYTILTQYKDERYPFRCDCYVKELDLFIEFQGSFYHNYRPFNGSLEHISEYEEMLTKGKITKCIAKVWRYADVKKRELAKKNRLNFLEYWEVGYLDEVDVGEYDPIKRWRSICVLDCA